MSNDLFALVQAKEQIPQSGACSDEPYPRIQWATNRQLSFRLHERGCQRNRLSHSTIVIRTEMRATRGKQWAKRNRPSPSIYVRCAFVSNLATLWLHFVQTTMQRQS
jgi:hypothetical protein